MRKVLFGIFILMLILPYAGASSLLSGWFKIPGEITAGKNTIVIEDVSLRDQSLLVNLKGEINEGFVLPLGHTVALNNLNLTLNRIMINSEGYSNMELHFPYLLEGESISFGEYRIMLDSVSEKQATLQVTYKNTTENIAYKGKTVSFRNLRISLKPMPLLFDGYLYRGDTEKIGEWNVTFEGYNITKDGDKLIAIIRLNINGKEYFTEVGKTLDTEGLKIEVMDLVGSEYLRIRAKLKGAYINVQVLPYFDGWIAEGKTTKIGPYTVRIEDIYGNRAYITIRNSCGITLRSGFVSVGNFTYMLSYGGLSLGAVAIREGKSEKQARIVAMLNESKIPKIEDVAFLNVSFEIPQDIKEYIPFKARVVLKNTGKTDLKYVEIIPNISKDFEILSGYPEYMPVIKKGEKVEFPITLKAISSGNLTVGSIRVLAHAPYILSCYDLKDIPFSSEIRRVRVPKAVFSYAVHINSRDGKVGQEIPVNITVRNSGNSNLPFDLTLAVPEGFGVIAKNFTIYGNWLHLRDSIIPNGTKVYKLSLVPSKEGRYEIVGVVSAGNLIFKNSTVITVSGLQETAPAVPHNESKPAVQNATNTTCKPEVITQTIKVPVPQNSTETVIGGTLTLKQKILYFGGSFAGGILFILLLAWVAAKMEERKR